MKGLEHWAHRLFPKLKFNDFIERMERLGAKRDVRVGTVHRVSCGTLRSVIVIQAIISAFLNVITVTVTLTRRFNYSRSLQENFKNVAGHN